MRMKKTLLLLVAAAMALTACNKTVTVEENLGDAISFRPLTNNMTKAANAAGLKTSFESGDVFNVYAAHNGSKYFQDNFTSDGATFSSTNKYYWPSDVATNHVTFTAIWGATQKADTPGYIDDFAPAAAVDSQKDVLVARHESSTKESPVTMNFRHVLSQIFVKAQNTNPNLEVQVYNVRVGYISTTGDFDYDKTSAGAATDAAGYVPQAKWTNVAAVASNKYDQAATLTLTGTTAASNLSSFTPWLLLPQNMVTAATGYNTATTSVVDPTSPDLATSYIALDMEIRNNSTGKPVIVARQWCYWPISTDWNPGYKYTYTIDVAGGGYQPTDTVGDDKTLDPVLSGAVIVFDPACTIDAWTDAPAIAVNGGI